MPSRNVVATTMVTVWAYLCRKLCTIFLSLALQGVNVSFLIACIVTCQLMGYT